jgi:hypothetical protein
MLRGGQVAALGEFLGGAAPVEHALPHAGDLGRVERVAAEGRRRPVQERLAVAAQADQRVAGVEQHGLELHGRTSLREPPPCR